MSQVLRPDSIQDLVKSSSTQVALPATSYVTVGGQQYSNSSTITLSTSVTGAGGLDTGTVAASSTYYVYGVVSASALALVASLSASTVVGFTAKKMIGAFATDASGNIDYIFSTAQTPGEPLNSVNGVEARAGQVLYSGREYDNLIINGNFDFWQRGTSITVTTNQDKYMADRWIMDAWGGGTYSVIYSQGNTAADVPTLTQSGFQSNYSATATNNSTDGSSTFRHIIEGHDILAALGKNIRVQFWVKSSIAGTYSVGFQNDAQNRSYVAAYTINNANTWEKKAIDLYLDPTGTWNTTNGRGLMMWWAFGQPQGNPSMAQATGVLNTWQAADKRWYNALTDTWRTTNGAKFQLSQVALYVVPTNGTGLDLGFARAGKSIARELQMCQRYYEKSYDVTDAPGSGTPGWYQIPAVNSGCLILTRFAVNKRISMSGLGGATTGPQFRAYSVSGAIDSVRDQSGVVDRAVSYSGNGSRGGTTFYSVYSSAVGAGAYVEFHWIADADFT